MVVGTSRGYRLYYLKDNGQIICLSWCENKKFLFNGGILKIDLIMATKILAFVPIDYKNFVIIFDDVS